MDDQNKNLILATALSFLVILVWLVLVPPPEQENLAETAPPPVEQPAEGANVPGTAIGAETLSDPAQTAAAETGDAQNAPRIDVETPRLSGSISLLGGRFDDLRLNDYKTELSDTSDIVTLLSPVGEDDAYYALYGWSAGGGLAPDAVPGPSTLWTQTGGGTLTPETPVTLAWDNGAGLRFARTIAVDEEYMFTITQQVTNTGTNAATIAPYGLIARHGEPKDLKNFFILHEGAVAEADGELTETDWSDMPDFDVDTSIGARAVAKDVTDSGWIGFTEHYWMTTLIPNAGTAFRQITLYDDRRDIYQTIARLPVVTLSPEDSASVETRFFAGAKEWETIRAYEDEGVARFIESIDWGWFAFLTKPIFWLLHEMNKLIGNMGWAIIGLTLVIKAILFPLAYKSYVSMAKMKELQPEMEKIKERVGDDRQKMQQEMMGLYQKEKVNPAAGCLPILLQIPIFFSLYKVIFVTIELRHAPFFGPFVDLSAPDPTSIMNFYGLLPFAGPEPGSILALLFIGILPLLLGVSMWLQQKLNPAPTDPTQQMIFAWMPWVFMFMLGSFASGLVVYWIANNVITFVQQYTIMRSQGYTPDILGNILSSFKKSGGEAGKK
jgi:YidC/Oxa1 family membrane protein insertase